MKFVILLSAVLLLIPSAAYPAHLGCGPPSGIIPESYVIQEEIDGIFDEENEIITPYPLNLDLSFMSPGPHVLRVKAVANDDIWGRLESEWSPFSFTRPSMDAITGIGLMK
jgi:hypothetical protein